MSRRVTQMVNENQLGLVLTGEGFSDPAETHGLLSLGFLLRHLNQSDAYAPQLDVEAAYELVCTLYRKHAASLRNQNEAFTCSTFLEPVMDALGWYRIPQQSMPGIHGLRKRPDYCLVTSEDAFAAASQADATSLFQLSATVLEAKRWEHPLDRMSARETPGWFPSQQIQDYLNHAKDATGQRFFDWAILTNGSEWRLYCEQSAVGAYFSFHLVRAGQVCSIEEFRLFVTLFRARSFDRTPAGRCFLDEVREQSLRIQADLENNLRKRIFGVLEDLGSAFLNYDENGIGEAEFPLLYDKSLIFLYRLLFVLYAESRGLLPVREYGVGSNRRYLNEFSLARLTGRLRGSSNYQDNAFCVLYEELLRLFNLINGTHPRQNAAIGVTRYNGGLFSPKAHAEIEQWRIGDKDLADILRQLIFAQPPARSREAQGQFSTDEAIDYSTLEVRQLGDIYEGLLGAHFEKVNGRLELLDENGENHSHGIFYTPDWIVQFLMTETLSPLLRDIEESAEVQRAQKARSEERRRDNSFAVGVLNLNLVDPAMGSGHFLVRATEWLADQIMNHPTTQPMTLQIVAQGERRMSREEILGLGKIPVSPGIPQEHTEKAYWRRRVVEACIHGVDINPMAVELAKLSLWLTCIAVDEPLNFLDHHLRQGNALLSVMPDELRRAPILGSQREYATFDLGDRLKDVLAGVIHDTLQIERRPSTEMDDVKEKEQLWKEVRSRLQPFFDLSDLWLAALDGVSVDELNYLSAARLLIADPALSAQDTRDAKRFMKSIAGELVAKKRDLTPFHWQLEFPDVFFNEEGTLLPPGKCGFDAILGNPPYVSIHTAMESGNRKMRDALDKRAGYVEDLYVHFTDLGFSQLRQGGGFGFIVSDTFFTLASKLRMREILQSHSLDWLGQCDPFDATVDAAIFVARKRPAEVGHRFRFVQARPLKRPDGSRTEPDENLAKLLEADALVWTETTPTPYGDVRHATESDLRVHEVPLALYTDALKRVFFEPRPGTLRLFERFNPKIKDLVAEWWERIENSRVFSANLDALRSCHRTLQPGDVTLVGLIAEGGQGMRTANNARFLAFLDGTPQADSLKAKAEEWSMAWLRNDRIRPRFTELLRRGGGDPAHPTADRAAWEAAVHGLREEFTATQLGFGRTALFRIAPPDLVADEGDLAYALERRKAELLEHWQGRRELAAFWNDPMEIDGRQVTHTAFRKATAIATDDFCRLCQALQLWITRENSARNAKTRIPSEAIGLRSSEDYADPDESARIATIYNGLYGRAQFVPFRKGDPTGSRWLDNEPLYCDWSKAAVDWLSTDSSARWQGHRYFLKAGVTWSLHANHVSAKCRYQEPCVFDASSSRLTPMIAALTAKAFVALANSDVFSFFLKKFTKHNQDIEINDMRIMPLVMPSDTQHAALDELATLAMSAKRYEFAGTTPDDGLVSRVREIGEGLRRDGPAYLLPSAQGLLLSGPGDCLEIIENAVNWEAEKLYGVEGLGPFNEF